MKIGMKKLWKFQEEKLNHVLSVIALLKKLSLLLVFTLSVEDVFSQMYTQSGKWMKDKMQSKKEKNWLISNQFVHTVKIICA